MGCDVVADSAVLYTEEDFVEHAVRSFDFAENLHQRYGEGRLSDAVGKSGEGASVCLSVGTEAVESDFVVHSSDCGYFLAGFAEHFDALYAEYSEIVPNYCPVKFAYYVM